MGETVYRGKAWWEGRVGVQRERLGETEGWGDGVRGEGWGDSEH